jgi:hypothetical protein
LCWSAPNFSTFQRTSFQTERKNIPEQSNESLQTLIWALTYFSIFFFSKKAGGGDRKTKKQCSMGWRLRTFPTRFFLSLFYNDWTRGDPKQKSN